MKKLLFLGLLVFSLIQPQVFAQTNAGVAAAANPDQTKKEEAKPEQAKKDAVNPEQAKTTFSAKHGKVIAEGIKAEEKSLQDATTDVGKAKIITEVVMEATKGLKGEDSELLNYKIAKNLNQETDQSEFLSNFNIALVLPFYTKSSERPAVEVTLEQDSTDPDYDTIQNLKRKPQTPRWMVELHLDWCSWKQETVAAGPFMVLGLGSGDTNPVSSAGGGFLLSIKGKGANHNKKFNFGIGRMYDYAFRFVKGEYTSDYYVKEKHKIKHGTDLYDTGLGQNIFMVSFNLGW